MTRRINNKTNPSGYKSNKQYFYKLSFVVIFLAPIILVFLYDRLAGGVFNGLAGSWKDPVISPDIFLLAINPIVLTLLYILLVKQFRKLRRIWGKEGQKNFRNDHILYI